MTLLLLALACTQPLVEGEVIDEAWGVRASLLDEALEVPCAGLAGGVGDYEVLVDDATGTSILLEAERAWIRGPFGLVSDRCWWLPEADAGPAPEEAACVRRGLQDGQCPPEDPWPEGWVFSTPGAVEVPGWTGTVAAAGTLLLAEGTALHRLDLTPSHHQPVDASEGARTYRGLLPSLEAAAPMDALALGADLVSWDQDEGRLWYAFGREAATVAPHTRWVRAPRGEGALAAEGVDDASVVVAASGEALVLWTRGSRRHRLASEAVHDAVLLRSFEAAVLQDGGVERIGGESHTWWPTPGARGLLDGAWIPYAWGNIDGAGVVYRLEDDGTARAWHLDEPLLGAGIGQDFQEIVLVTEGPEGPHVTGWIDRAHAEALGPGTVGLALAAFAETPRDADYASEEAAALLADDLGLCEAEEGEDLVCCVHAERAARLEHNLAWLGARLEARDGAAVLGINPTAVAQSARCGDGAYPEALGDWLLDHEDRASAALFAHSAPYARESWWVTCPEADPEAVPEDCWDIGVDEATFGAFYDTLSAAAALAPWVGTEPDWRLVGGGYEGASLEGVVGWTRTFPALVLPDGSPPEDGLYFGLAAMDPRVSAVAAKEIAPLDARRWAYALPVTEPPGDWYEGASDAMYWPGQSFASSRVHELGRSGLRFAEWAALADREADWTTDRYPGDEDPDVMTRADFLAMEHILVSRVLAHRTWRDRWWTLHLQNLASLRAPPLDEGWMDCPGPCDGDSELDRFMERLETWDGIVTWTPLPP